MRHLFFLLLLLPLCDVQCSVSCGAAPVVNTEYRWLPCVGTENQLALICSQGKHIGNFWIAGSQAGKYFKYLGNDVWETTPSVPPFAVPQKYQHLIKGDGPAVNYGVDLDKLGAQPRYLHNGVEVSKEEAHKIVGDKSLPNDANLLRITVIGPEVRRKQVLADLETSPVLQVWKDKLVKKSYDPSHWAVKDSGFTLLGDPVIYVQDPSGKVLHKQVDYSDGADGLARALRKVDPNYDPKRDPDLRSPLQFPDLGLPLPVLILCGFGLFLLLKKD